MIYSYVLTPDIFDTAVVEGHSFAVGELLTRIRRNGVIPDLNGDLRREIWDAAKRLPETLTRKRLLEELECLAKRNRFVRDFERGTIEDATSEMDWHVLAASRHSTSPIHLTVSDETLHAVAADNFPVESDFGNTLVAIQALHESPRWNAAESQCVIPRTLAAYREVLTPFLRSAKRLTILDPHLNPSEPRFAHVVREILRLAGKERQDAGKRVGVRALVEQHPNDPAKLDGWREFVRQNPLPGNVDLEVTVVPRNRSAGRFHDRFLLTEQSGITLGDSLDTGNGNATWTLLEEPAFEHHHAIASDLRARSDCVTVKL